jgi:hypothetical protein
MAVSFFICQAHVGQDVVDGLDGAFEAEAHTDLLKGEIGLLGNKGAKFAAVGVEDDRLAATAMVAGSDVTGVKTLMEELLDHAERHFETAGHLLAGRITAIIGFEDALTEIHRNRCHAEIMATNLGMAIILFKML